jgi:hypothetical protein
MPRQEKDIQKLGCRRGPYYSYRTTPYSPRFAFSDNPREKVSVSHISPPPIPIGHPGHLSDDITGITPKSTQAHDTTIYGLHRLVNDDELKLSEIAS